MTGKPLQALLLTIEGLPGAIAGALVALGALVVMKRPALGPPLIAAVAFLLPFAVPPLEVFSLSPSFLDFALFFGLAAWWVPLLRHHPPRPLTGPLGFPLLLFLIVALVSFVIAWERTTPPQARMFLKLIDSVLLYFTVINVIRSQGQLEGALRVAVVCATIAGLFGVVLYLLPEHLDYNIRDALSMVGYPGGSSIVRQIAGTEIRRATGTAVDPNLLGGMLALAVPVATAQALGSRPLLPRRLLWCAVLLMLAAQVLSYSRGAWLASGTGLAVVALLRYPKAWLVLAVIPLFLILPQGEVIVDRAASALGATDPASQMRLGEYKDALALIARYPLFGVGFGRPPEATLYVGVSNIYLLIAEMMGLAGLAVFVAVLGWLAAQVLARIVGTSGRPDPSLAGAAGAVAAALAAGFVDHYFFNPQIPHTTTLFWLFVGLLARAAAIHGRQTNALSFHREG